MKTPKTRPAIDTQTVEVTVFVLTVTAMLSSVAVMVGLLT
jgi:hypothetical protein